ncbi:MAG: GntP family permease [Balneolaceae bacterium]|nr:GntP family permease [Balneolaceae bacterium]
MISFLWLLLVVVLIIWMTSRLKLHPFLALLFGTVVMGVVSGLPVNSLLTTLAGGFGSTLESIGIVIAAGTIIGEYLNRSGGASVMANKLLRVTGEKKAPLAMSMTGYIVSIPVFCDSGFIVLSSLMKAIARKTGTAVAVLAIALASGLYATHVFVPPTPGPLAAAATLGADVGRVLILGLCVSVPVMLIALAWAHFWCGRYRIELDFSEEAEISTDHQPSFYIAAAPIIIPILLIALKSVAEYPSAPFGESLFFSMIVFIGNPIMALLIGVILSFFMVGRGERRIKNQWLEEALKKAGVIILITGAGGAFGAVLRETGIGEFASRFASADGLGIIIPFLIAAFLKTAQGSSTVSIITTAGICVPLLDPMGLSSETGIALAVLAIGAGALTVSHVNDSYFWVVAKFSDMDTATALKTHTTTTFVMGLSGYAIIQLMAVLLL